MRIEGVVDATAFLHIECEPNVAAASTNHFATGRGLLGLGYRMTVEALGRADAQRRSPARCRGLTDAGQLGFFMGRYDDAARCLEESLSIAREMGDVKRIVGALQPLGMSYLALGNLEQARAHLTEALRLAENMDNPRELAAANNALAQFHRVEGALDKAAPLYDRVVALARQLGDQESIAIGLLNLCMVLIGRRSHEGVRTMLLEVIDIIERTGSRATTQSVLDVCVGLAALLGQAPQAARFYAVAEALGRQTGLKRDPADAAFVAASIVTVLNAMGLPAFEAALAGSPGIDGEAALGEARTWLEAAP